MKSLWKDVRTSSGLAVKDHWKRVLGALPIPAIRLACVALILVGYRYPWTGFGEVTKRPAEYQPEKKLWDWLDLLLVPLGLGFFAYWLGSREKKSEAAQKERELDFQTNRFREDALQRYFDNVAQWVPGEQSVVRARTLTALQQLDAKCQVSLIRCLYESQLLTEHRWGLLLDGADLSVVDLSGAGLAGAHLEGANLSGADLGGADLTRLSDFWGSR